jgi:hypothetical protein
MAVFNWVCSAQFFLFFGHPHSQSFRRRPLGFGGQVGATRLETTDDWAGVHLSEGHFSNWW